MDESKNDDRNASEHGSDDPLDPFVVTTELDLHGLYPEQVPPMLEDFIRNAREKGYPDVKIIHGKGRSTMKRVVLEFLDKNPLVESYRDAFDSHSGWGATVAVIRQGGSPEKR